MFKKLLFRYVFFVIIFTGARNTEAVPAFDNSDFERGDFTNWSIHENWQVINPGSMLGLRPANRKIKVLGNWGTSSVYRLGERTIARYSGTSTGKFPRKLESLPFTVNKRFLVFSFWKEVRRAPGFPMGKKIEISIGVDTNLDGNADVKLSSKQLKRTLHGQSIFAFDLKKNIGKKVRFIAKTDGLLISIDNLRLEDSPPITTHFGKFSDSGTNAQFDLQFYNNYNVPGYIWSEVVIKNYYGKILKRNCFKQAILSGVHIPKTFTWKKDGSPQYRIEVLTKYADGHIMGHLFKRYYADEVRHGRPALKFGSGWQVTESDNKTLELPKTGAKWVEESPCRPSGTFGYRKLNIWNKYQNRAQVWYRKQFTVPEWLKGGHLFLNLANGGAGLMAIYLNGKEIKFDHIIFNFVISDYDLTPALKSGKNTLILRFRNPKIYFVDKNGYWLEPIRDYYGIPMGIYGNIYLEKRPEITVDKIFIDSFLSTKKLDVRVRLKNNGTHIRKVHVTLALFDRKGRKVLEFKPENVELKDRETHTFKFSQHWPNPILWTPDQPELLRLGCTVSNGVSGETVSTRFGFREFSIKGNKFLLNGYPISISDVLMREPESLGAWKYWWGANAVRSPWISMNMADHGDEDGYLMRTVFEWYYIGQLHNKLMKSIPQRHIKAFQKIQLKTMEYFYNHPAIYMWNLGNELDGHGYFQSDVKTFYTSVFKPIVEAVNRFDPQRPCTSSGDAIMPFWRKHVWSVHYPHEYNIAHDLPNEARLLSGKKPLHVLAPRLPYDNKPVFCGENFTESGIAPYLSSLSGDKPIDFESMFDTWKEYFRIRYRTYREDGITSSAPFSPIGTLRNYFPIEIYPIDYIEQFYSGQKVNMKVKILHDIFSYKEYQLHYNLNGVCNGSVPVNCTPGDRKIVEINLKLPDIKRRSNYKLSLYLTQNGKKLIRWGSWQGTLSVWPRRQANGHRVGVWDGEKEILQMLIFFGFKPIPIMNASELKKVNFLLIRGTDFRKNSSILKNWVEHGGLVMPLIDSAGQVTNPPKAVIAVDHKDTRAFNVAKHSSFMKGIESRDLFFWNKNDFRVCYYSFLRPEDAHYRSLVVNGDQEGLRFSPYMFKQYGKGGYLFCSLLLDKVYQRVPVAGQLLINAANYTTNKKFSQVKAAAVVRDELQKLFDRNGLEIMDIATLNPKDIELSQFRLLIVDAAVANVSINQLKKFVKNGGTLIIKYLTINNIEKFRPLLGNKLKLVKADRKGNSAGMLTKTGNYQLFDSITNGDLLWKRGRIYLFASQAKDMRNIIAHPANYVFSPESTSDQTLFRPAVLLQRTVGHGQILIDQVCWDEAAKNELKAERVLCTLLKNIGIGQRRHNTAKKVESTFKPLPLPLNYDFCTGLFSGEENIRKFFKVHSMNWQKAKFVFGKTPQKALILGNLKNKKKMIRKVKVNCGFKMDKIHILQSSAFGYIDWSTGKPVVEFTVIYSDSSQEKFKSVYGKSLDDYRVRSSSSLAGGEQFTIAERDGLSTYIKSWKNPNPEKTINAIEIASVDNKIVPIFLAITAEHKLDGTYKLQRRRSGLWSVRKMQRNVRSSGRVWAIAGPFPNKPKEPYSNEQKAFINKYSPEYSINLKQHFRQPTGNFTWKKYIQKLDPAKPGINDFMPIDNILDFGIKADKNSYVSYLFTKFYSTKKQKVLIAFGSDDAGKIWLNAKLIHKKWAMRGAKLGDDMIEAILYKGWNTILIKHLKMRLGAGIAFDIKPYNKHNMQLYNTGQHRKFAELPSLLLEYNAYAAEENSLPAIVALRENGKLKMLSGLFKNSGVISNNDIFKVNFSYAGRQAIMAAYNPWTKDNGAFKSGEFSMDFIVPKKASAPHINLVARNAGGYNIGDVYVTLMGGEDTRQKPAAQAVPFRYLRLGCDVDISLFNTKHKTYLVDLRKHFKGGLPEGVWHCLKIIWGNGSKHTGLKLFIDDKLLVDEPKFKDPLFSSKIFMQLAMENRIKEQGELWFRNVKLTDYTAKADK